MPRTNGGNEEWLYSGIRVTDADNNDIDQADLIFAEVGQGPITGATITATEDDAAGQAFTPRTNSEGIPPRFWLPSPGADVSADGGATWFTIGTVERAAEREAVLNAAVAAEASAASANLSSQTAQAAGATVAGFDSRLTLTEQRTATVPDLVEQVNAGLDQLGAALTTIQELSGDVQLLKQQVAAGGGGGGVSFRHWFAMTYDEVLGQYEFPTLADAEAAGFIEGSPLLILGEPTPPDWVRQGSTKTLHATSGNVDPA